MSDVNESRVNGNDGKNGNYDGADVGAAGGAHGVRALPQDADDAVVGTDDAKVGTDDVAVGTDDAARSSLPWESVRRSVSKVAGLPLKVRELVNQRILDGKFCKDIAAELKGLGFEVSEASVSRWSRSRSGYVEWLSRRERRAERREKAKDLADEVKKMRKRDAFAQMNHLVVADCLNEVLEKLDAKDLLAMARKDPGMFFRLVRAVNAQFLGEVLAKRADVEVRKQRAAERALKRKTAPKPKGGVTKEKLEEIKSRLNIM